MITLAYKENEKSVKTTDLKKIIEIPHSEYLWLDLLNITEEERSVLEKMFKVKLQLLKKKKIRHSFRFIEKDDIIKINTRLLHWDGKKLIGKSILFVLKDSFLITSHNISHLSFDDEFMELESSNMKGMNGKIVFLKIFGKILEYDIDIIERVTQDIVSLSRQINSKENLDEDLIYTITTLQDRLIVIRRNIIDKQRVILSLSKTDHFTKSNKLKIITVIEKDIQSILDYISFDFERLEYLQNTLMGLINLRQNIIMKIFTIVSVIFLPPTLIASIYGMNFQNMPELNFQYAYPVAITVMAILSLLALYYFKRKKWI